MLSVTLEATATNFNTVELTLYNNATVMACSQKSTRSSLEPWGLFHEAHVAYV